MSDIWLILDLFIHVCETLALQTFMYTCETWHIMSLLRTQQNSFMLVMTLFKYCRLVVLIEHQVDECINCSGCNINYNLCVFQLPLPIVLE